MESSFIQKRGPLDDEVTEDMSILFSKPIKDLWIIVFQCGANAVTQIDSILYYLSPIFQQLRQCSDICRFRLDGSQSIHVFFEHLGLQKGIAGIILGATEKESLAILGD